MKNQRPPLFERLQEALHEGLDYARGETELKTTTVHLPDPPAPMSADQIRALRRKLAFSQVAFARLLVVSPKTVQSWEQGHRSPTGSACRLLQLLESPELVKAFVGQATA